MSKTVQGVLIAVALLSAFFNASASAQEGDQVINGTPVHTIIDRQRGVAIFSNSCGTQSLRQGQLQQGAIPNDIIPCPRPSSPAPRSIPESASHPNNPPPRIDLHAEANALIQKGGNAARASDFSAAAVAYKQAAQDLQAAGDRLGAATASRLYAAASCNGDIQTLHHTIAAGKAPSITGINDIDPQFESMCRNAGFSAALDSARQVLKVARDAEMRQAAKQPPASQPAVPTPSNQPSASCSDITGTGSTAPAATDCKEANTALHAARVTREKYPAVSADEYKKAAAAARRAGDIQLELSILREATMPPPTAPEEEPCAAAMREAASYVTGAEAIKRNDSSCHGLTQAAENYFTAGKIFLRAVKPNQSQEEIAKSCEYKKANEMFLRRDELNDLVDMRRRNGSCESSGPAVQRTNPTTPPGQSQSADEEHKKDCAGMRARLAPHAINEAWIIDQMRRSGCNPDGTPM